MLTRLRTDHYYHTLIAGIGLFILGIFGFWWLQPSHIPHNFSGFAHSFDILLYILVTYIVWHPLLMEVLSWSITSHIQQPKPQKPEPGLRVAFVTTFVPGSESISLLKKTLPAMLRADYKHDTWVLDEGNDPDVRQLCKELGVKHFSRFGKDHYNTADGKFARKTKGGNHNSWYDKHGNKYDIVAQIDTDFIPRKTFLTKTLGYFNNPKVGWVGTPQVYGNTRYSLIARGAAQQTFSFYGPVLRGMNGMESTMLIGANHVIRVAALKEVDYYSAHITEDLLTGMKLHANGWKSVYVPEVLAVGEGPSTWKAYFAQQKRWAYGCMHILFNHSFRLTRTMSLRQAFYYLLIQQHYFTGVIMALSTLCIVLYFVFGITTANIDFLTYIVLYGTSMLTCFLVSLSMQRFNVRPKKEKGLMPALLYINFAVWPVFLMAFLELFKRKKLAYKVTPKGKGTKKRHETPLTLFRPHLIIAGISFVGLVSSFFTHRTAILMEFYSVVTCIMMITPPLLVPAYTWTKRRLAKFYTVRVQPLYAALLP